MSMDVDIVGLTGTKAEVNAANQLKVVLETNAIANTANIGGVKLFSENDAGTLTGAPYLRSPETSTDHRLRVGIDTVLFTDTFNAITQNTTNWSYTAATLLLSGGGSGYISFSGSGTAATHGAYYRSSQYFPIVGTAPVAFNVAFGQAVSPLVANEVFIAGLTNTPANSGVAPTDGVWLQLTTGGLIGVLAYNGVITQTGILQTIASLVVGNIYNFRIIIGETEVEFWNNGVLLGEIIIPAGNGQPCLSAAQAITLQKYCTGVVSNTNNIRVTDVTVSLMDIATNKPWATQMALQGMAGYVGQNGFTQGKTSLWTNNTAPTAAVLTNTAAAFTGLGGIAAILPTLAAQSDGIVFAYQNPVPSINITGRNLVITGVTVQSAVSVILAGGPVTYVYALAFGMTALTQVTTETATFITGTTHAPRILPIGIESFVVTAPVGTLGSSGLQLRLNTPVVVRPGEWVALLARNIGVVTTTGAITNITAIDSYWE